MAARDLQMRSIYIYDDAECRGYFLRRRRRAKRTRTEFRFNALRDATTILMLLTLF